MTAGISSNFILLMLVSMDSSSLTLLICLIFLHWNVRCDDDTNPNLLPIVETQYLTFDMSQYGLDGGVFSSPNFPDYYPHDTIMFYQFKAMPNYRVQIEIDFFQIRGVTPQCTHDYLDVFINVTDFNFVQTIISDQLLHRYCGRNKPPLLVSFTNLLVLGFFTEDTQTERGFNGSFRFISAQPYKNNLREEPCDYIFESSVSKRGKFFSSTYPGTYLPWQFCNYSFVGAPNERVHIRFHDFMLYKTPNTQHCAVDLLKVYDNNLDPVELRRFLSNFRPNGNSNHQVLSEKLDQHHITDLCGTYTIPLDLYSASHRLLLYFIATHYAEWSNEDKIFMDEKSTFFWRKGFYAEYEFLSTVTKLDFITKNKSNQYLAGTECDQTIKSFGLGYGKFQSPHWPHAYKPQTSCSTYFLGLDDRYTLENVEIEFDHFDIDCQLASLVIYNASRIYDYRPWSSTYSSLTSSFALSTHPYRTSLFSNFYRQELDFKDNLSFCGHFKPEGRFVSQAALLKISFIPNDRTEKEIQPKLNVGGKYQAKYRFVRSYHQVTADEYDETSPTACNLSFYQRRLSAGKFEPPRASDGDYFSNLNCTFNFHISNDSSHLLVWYEYFNVVQDKLPNCTADNLSYSYQLVSSLKVNHHPVVYCGYRNFPPPYLTPRFTRDFRIHFRSNDDSDASIGFDGRYQFLNQSHQLFSSSCRSPYDAIIHVNENDSPSGNLSSNGYPENVICEWSYSGPQGLHFRLQLNLLDMEGSKTKDPPQGCQSSVLRIFSEGKLEELCGQQEKPTEYFTDSNWFRIQFISMIRQTREPLRGFELSWTLIKIKKDFNLTQNSIDNQFFDCQTSSTPNNITLFYIPQSLVCDGYAHCEPISGSDESLLNCRKKVPSTSDSSITSLVLFVRQYWIFTSAIVTLSILTTILCLSIRKKINARRHQCLVSMDQSNKEDSDNDAQEDDQDSINIALMEQAVTTV